MTAGSPVCHTGPSGSLKRVLQGRGAAVPGDYVQQDWQLLQASIQRKQPLLIGSQAE